MLFVCAEDVFFRKADRQLCGVGALAVLEAGNGADSRGTAGEWQNHAREPDFGRSISRRHDSHCRLQHEKGHQRKRDNQGDSDTFAFHLLL